MIDLRTSQLRTAVTVAEELHFGRAAERLGVAQSSVSQQVRAIERAVGFALLERTSRRVGLTPAGNHFLSAARRVLNELDRAGEEGLAVSAGELGTLRVAAAFAARISLIPEVLAVLARDRPGLRLDVRPTTTAGGLDALALGAADVALGRDSTAREGIEIEPVAGDPIMVVLPADHALAGRRALTLSRLRGMPRIGWARAGAPDYFDRIAALLEEAGVDPIPAYELSGVDTRLGAIAAGLGWGLESGAYRSLMEGRVAFVPIKGEPLRGEIVVAYPSLRRSPGLDAFLAAVREVVARHPRA